MAEPVDVHVRLWTGSHGCHGHDSADNGGVTVMLVLRWW